MARAWVAALTPLSLSASPIVRGPQAGRSTAAGSSFPLMCKQQALPSVLAPLLQLKHLPLIKVIKDRMARARGARALLVRTYHLAANAARW